MDLQREKREKIRITLLPKKSGAHLIGNQMFLLNCLIMINLQSAVYEL